MRSPCHTFRFLTLALAFAFLPGCKALLDSIYNTYTGPPPATQGLSDERVILRSLQNAVNGKPQHYYLDRLRFLDRGDSLHIDRVVIGIPGEIQATIDSLGLRKGDTLVVSTSYRGTYFSGGLEADIPNWGANRYHERYPVALHLFTKVEKASR